MDAWPPRYAHLESKFQVSSHRRTSILIMKSEFRSTSPRDAGAISAFLQRVLAIGPEHPVIEPRHLHWKNWEERPEWSGSRGYIITKENEIVAHGTVVPLEFEWQDKRLKVVYLIDWAADPKSVGSGVSMMQRCLPRFISTSARCHSKLPTPSLCISGWRIRDVQHRPKQPCPRQRSGRCMRRLRTCLAAMLTRGSSAIARVGSTGFTVEASSWKRTTTPQRTPTTSQCDKCRQRRPGRSGSTGSIWPL